MLDTQIFGIHEQALNIHVRRAQIIAHNLANAETPNYRARDIDFKVALEQAATPQAAQRLNQTHKNHLAISESSLNAAFDAGTVQYRTPLQQGLDGNTVDTHIEHAAYAENTLRYLANVTFMNHRLQALNVVLSGGR